MSDPQTLAAVLKFDGATESVACRRCRQRMEVPAYVVDMARAFNHDLHRRGEAPIAKSELAVCDSCRPHVATELDTQARADGERISRICRDMRHGQRPTTPDWAWIRSVAPHAFAEAYGTSKQLSAALAVQAEDPRSRRDGVD